ncbi:uncharacterized protein V6R79_002924 [Siganus canaliculatus]
MAMLLFFFTLQQSSTKTKEEKKEVEKKKKWKFCGRLLQCFKKNRISPEPLVEDRAVEKNCSTMRAETEKAEERMEDTQSRVQGRLGCLMTVVRCHDSANILAKLSSTLKLKKVLSIQAPEFMDHQQKDAHEFLTAILDQVASLAGPLEERARFLGMSYTCPVKNNMQFLMKLSRTCRRCLTGSTREETFTNLSLNPEEDLDYTCVCGGKTSSQQSTFLTLPKILILHLKRFKYTPSLQLKKVLDPVRLQMNVKVSTHQAQNSYSLVSILSHLGRNMDWGHYISDGVDLTESEEQPPLLFSAPPMEKWTVQKEQWIDRLLEYSVIKRIMTAFISETLLINIPVSSSSTSGDQELEPCTGAPGSKGPDNLTARIPAFKAITT